MHRALAALLDESPEGCFLCGGERGKLFNRITLLLKTILIL